MVDLETTHIEIADGNADVTVDRLFDGRLVCLQPKRGYRYSVDSLLLAHFATIDNDDRILDIGCGCGIVGLIILCRWQKNLQNVTGLELQPELARLAERNAELNGFDRKYTIRQGDLRSIKSLFAAESFSRIVCNPPFYGSSSGRGNVDRQSLIARHQVCSSTSEISSAASYTVKNKGTVSLVFPAEGLFELLCSFEQAKLQPKRMRMVYSYPEKNLSAKLVLVEAVKNGGPGLKILPPLYIYTEKKGPYSDEMQDIFTLEGPAGLSETTGTLFT